MRWTSAICPAAASRSRWSSCAASSLFSAITDRFRPRTSCRSRPNRSRSSATASLASVSLAASSRSTTFNVHALVRKAAPHTAAATAVTAPITRAAPSDEPRRAAPIPQAADGTAQRAVARRSGSASTRGPVQYTAW